MPTLNYTTKIAVESSIAEIQAMLVEHGADAVATTYQDRLPTGISFKLTTAHGQRAFSLPVDVDSVRQLLVKQSNSGAFRSDGYRVPKFETSEHAARVAWRVLKDWVEAQLAIIEAQMATIDQVMLPYLHVDGDRTLYDNYRDHELRALGAAST